MHEFHPRGVTTPYTPGGGQTFEGKTVRVLNQGGGPWFVVAGVCRLLEIANGRDTVSRLDADEKNTVVITDGTRGNAPTTCVGKQTRRRGLLLSLDGST